MTPLEIHGEEPPAEGEVVFSAAWPSRLDRKEEIVGLLQERFLAQAWVGEDDAYWLQLCLEEAVINAMLHGNEGDPRLEIRVEIRHSGKDWILVISDQGDGFDVSDLPDVDEEEALLLEHGRGILLMREWLDDLRYYRGGSVAWLRREIGKVCPQDEE